jgi:uncharacterized membrane protein
MNVIDAASLTVSGAGVVAGAATLAATRRAALALAIALELWTAAGLLKLTAEGTWRSVATAGMILLLRKLVVSAIKRPPVTARA